MHDISMISNVVFCGNIEVMYVPMHIYLSEIHFDIHLFKLCVRHYAQHKC